MATKRIKFSRLEIEALIGLCAYAGAGTEEDIGFGPWDTLTKEQQATYNAIFTADEKLRAMREKRSARERGE